MTGKELAKLLRALADKVESMRSVDGLEPDLGPNVLIRCLTKEAARSRRYRDRHRDRRRDVRHDGSAVAVTGTVTNVTQIQGGATGGASGVAHTFSKRSKDLEVVEDTDRSSREQEPATEATSTTTSNETPVRHNGRKFREPPLPRRDLLCAPMLAKDWEPTQALTDYAVECGLDERQILQVTIELRDKYASQGHTIDWWDDRFCRFVEQRVKSGPRKASTSDEQDILLANQDVRLEQWKSDLA